MSPKLRPLIPLGIFLGSLAIGYIALAWTAPIGAPPSNNVSAPINVSGTAQNKAGNLYVGSSSGSSSFPMRVVGNGTDTSTLWVDGASVLSGTTNIGQAYLTNSDIYFNNTTHNHTGIGNTAGYAAIENADNYNTLMILGRSGGIGGVRSVSIWDRLDVNGNTNITGTLASSAYNPLNFTYAGYSSPNGTFRLTPNIHINTPTNYGVIINWDNGATSDASVGQFTVADGAGGVLFNVAHNGNTLVNGQMCLNGDCRTAWPTGGGAGYKLLCSATNGSNQNITSSSGATVVSATSCTTDGVHSVLVSVDLPDTGPPQGGTSIVEIRRDNVTVDNALIYPVNASGSFGGIIPIAFRYLDAPGAGTHTYSVVVEVIGTSGTFSTIFNPSYSSQNNIIVEQTN